MGIFKIKYLSISFIDHCYLGARFTEFHRLYTSEAMYIYIIYIKQYRILYYKSTVIIRLE